MKTRISFELEAQEALDLYFEWLEGNSAANGAKFKTYSYGERWITFDAIESVDPPYEESGR